MYLLLYLLIGALMFALLMPEDFTESLNAAAADFPEKPNTARVCIAVALVVVWPYCLYLRAQSYLER